MRGRKLPDLQHSLTSTSGSWTPRTCTAHCQLVDDCAETLPVFGKPKRSDVKHVKGLASKHCLKFEVTSWPRPAGEQAVSDQYHVGEWTQGWIDQSTSLTWQFGNAIQTLDLENFNKVTTCCEVARCRSLHRLWQLDLPFAHRFRDQSCKTQSDKRNQATGNTVLYT